ncbi:hypothetical protein [Streptomyces zagrosensis]|uniref:Peptidase inhibitor family I36 protein n=1 Tax=Streptomyces zagrosensis TaxID=1042984 RepID=A0A7W9QFQ5_9ACTN|nr:hypothetical protein [Streptomyces zagrosensis]MBB5938182.1 hypothetical protein [Streptomyces zagrosensis]
MNAKRILLAATALAAVTITTAPTAQATPAPQRTSAAEPAPTTAHATGILHLWEETGYQSWCADYDGHSSDWGDCRNKVSSLHNNGYPGNLDDVYVYWGRNHSGARRGIYNGVAISNLYDWRYENAGSGANERLDNNIASHRWVNLP